MAGMGIDGLVSGLDTTSLINSLMAVEAKPQTLLKASITSTTAFISALQSLNVKVASLATSAEPAALPASWCVVTARSSDTSVTATTSDGAQASSLSFTVDNLASTQTSVSPLLTDATALTDLFGGPAPATVTIASGLVPEATVTVVDLAGVTTLAGLASAINDADTGVTATVVRVSDTQSRLQLTSTATGLDAAFDLYSGTVLEADVRAGTAVGVVVARGDAIAAASDAAITLWAGTTAEQEVTSATNTFATLLTGVSLTVTALEASPVTVTVERDDAALTALASGLVGALGVVLSEIVSRTASTTTTAADGGSVVTGGVLSGDSAVRALQQAVVSALADPLNEVSPSEVGIVIGKDGTFTFDSAVFAAALAADPARVQSIVTGLAARVAEVATAASDSIDGTLTIKITSQEAFNKDLSEQVADWDRRLAMRREGLRATYSALEVMLSKLQSQSSWLTSQLDALSANSSSNS